MCERGTAREDAGARQAGVTIIGYEPRELHSRWGNKELGRGDAEHKDTFHLLPSASQAGESENNKEKRAKSCHASRLLC